MVPEDGLQVGPNLSQTEQTHVQRQVHEQVDVPTVIVTKVGHKR